MRTVSKLWRRFYAGLEEINPARSPLENEVVKNTMTTTRGYKMRASRIVEYFNIKNSILEIGCGYGGQALAILEEISISYTVVENEKMLNQAKKFLGKKVEYIDAKQIRTLKNREFGFFISHHCLSETPPEYREYILKNIIKNCQRIFIIDINDGHIPNRRMREAGYEIVPLNIEKWIRKYFIYEKIMSKRKQSTYIGERLT